MEHAAHLILIVLACIFVPLIVVFGIGEYVSRRKRVKAMIEKWASSLGVRLIDYYSAPALLPDKFFWTAGKAEVYRVAVEYADGCRASGYVRCGNWYAGILADDVTVKWDDDAIMNKPADRRS